METEKDYVNRYISEAYFLNKIIYKCYYKRATNDPQFVLGCCLSGLEFGQQQGTFQMHSRCNWSGQ